MESNNGRHCTLTGSRSRIHRQKLSEKEFPGMLFFDKRGLAIRIHAYILQIMNIHINQLSHGYFQDHQRHHTTPFST